MKKTIILLALTCLLTLTACSGTGPESIAAQYWDAILDGDEETAKELLADPDQSGPETVIAPGSGSQVSFGEVDMAENTARVATLLEWVDEDNTATYPITTVLVQQDGQWRIDAHATRRSLINSVYQSTLTELQKTFEQSAEEFRKLGEQLVEGMEDELSEAGRVLQENAEQANEELNTFLEKLDEQLVEEIRKRSGETLEEEPGSN